MLTFKIEHCFNLYVDSLRLFFASKEICGLIEQISGYIVKIEKNFSDDKTTYKWKIVIKEYKSKYNLFLEKDDVYFMHLLQSLCNIRDIKNKRIDIYINDESKYKREFAGEKLKMKVFSYDDDCIIEPADLFSKKSPYEILTTIDSCVDIINRMQ